MKDRISKIKLCLIHLIPTKLSNIIEIDIINILTILTVNKCEFDRCHDCQ